MKANKMLLAVAIVSLLAVQVLTANTLFAGQEKTQVVSLSTPFGTSGYVANSALEQVFKKAGSWVNFQIKETPGAMYMAKYFFQNKGAMVNGEIPQLTVNTSTGILGHVNDPRPPFEAFKGGMEQRAIFSTHTALVLFTTFDSSIKDLKGLAGKKVGVNEKPRIFTGTLLHRPYFEKGLGIWDKVDWQMIGKVNSKNAMLNNQIDAHSSTLSGKLEIQKDGTLICRKVAPATATMELLNSGKTLHYIDTDPDIIKKSYDFEADMRVYPVLIKKGAHESIDRDIWARAVMGIYVVHESMPYEVVKEIIRVRYAHHGELAKFHAGLGLWPENPFPIGVPDKWLHTGVKKAMKELNIPMP